MGTPQPACVQKLLFSHGVCTWLQAVISGGKKIFKDLVNKLEIILAGNIGSEVPRARSRMESWVQPLDEHVLFCWS